MVGSAICRQLQKKSDVETITRTRDELDLCDQRAVYEFLKSEKPDEVILAAAKVGGIFENKKQVRTRCKAIAQHPPKKRFHRRCRLQEVSKYAPFRNGLLMLYYSSRFATPKFERR